MGADMDERRLRHHKSTDSEPIQPATFDRLFTLLSLRYPGKVWRVVEVSPSAVVKTIDNEQDAQTTIANLERRFAADTP